MARGPKSGLDYFPFETDFFRDRKIKRLRRTFGDKGVTIYLFLLTEIYRDKGYYVNYDEELVIDVANDLGINENLVNDVINIALSYDLFSKSLYDSDRVLTSKGIQKRFLSIQNLARRKISGRLPYLISSEEMSVSAEEIPVSSEEMSVSAEEIEQKKSKEKEIKGNKRKITPLPPKSENVLGVVGIDFERLKDNLDPSVYDPFCNFIRWWNDLSYTTHDRPALNDITIEVQIKRLYEISRSPQTQIKALEQTILYGWKSIHYPKGEGSPNHGNDRNGPVPPTKQEQLTMANFF